MRAASSLAHAHGNSVHLSHIRSSPATCRHIGCEQNVLPLIVYILFENLYFTPVSAKKAKYPPPCTILWY